MEHKKSSPVLFGAHIGEHGVDKEQILHDIRVSCVERGMNFVIIRTPRNKAVEPEFFLEWAKYLKEHKVYFMFLYTIQHAPADRISQFTPELVTKIREIAGEYFLGDMLGELGCVFCGKLMMIDGVAQSVTGQDSYRTCVGLTENGDLIIICIETCTYDMAIRAFEDMNMGVTTILNMDGGGSTTLYTTDSNWTSSYDICGDGWWPRDIADAIAIVAG